jgi:DNA-binding CsgD family transcriptional regulator
MEPGAQVRDRLRAAAAGVVGRERELTALRNLLQRGKGPAVVFVSGPGGIGKSTTVAAAAATLDHRPLIMDGRSFEPTPSGFFSSLVRALDGTDIATAQAAAAALDRADVGTLVVDSYERLNLLDGWLRNDFLTGLPARLTTVVVGRRPPNLAWRTASGWRQLTAELVVGPMDDADARLLVERRGLPSDTVTRIVRFGRGHPLALELLAEALARHPDLHLPGGPPAEVIEELCDVLLDDLDPVERRSVENAAVLRRVTQPMLAAVLADADPLHVEQAWRALRGLPFTRLTAVGMEIQSVARQAIAGALEIRDPARVRQLRRRAAVAALRDVERAPGWETTADLLYLVQNPVIRNSYLPPVDQQHPVEAASSDDLPAVLAIAERHDGRPGAEIVEEWWRSHRRDFVVGRGVDGEVTAFSILVPLAEVDDRLAALDAVLAAILADARQRPLPAGGVALVHRRALGRRRGEQPSPELGAMVVDMKRRYLELRPALARVYAAVGGWQAQAPVMRSLGFDRIGPEIAIGTSELRPCALDFGVGSVDGWLQRLVLAEAAPPDPPPPVAGADPAVFTQLSAREREVLTVLAEGVTNQELAARLFISERTANRHLSNIFTKLGVRTRTAAARIAIQAGLVG